MRTSVRPRNFMAVRGSWRRWLGPAVLAAAVSAAGGAHADDGVLAWIVKSISADEDGDIIQASAMRGPQIGTALVAGQQIATGGGQHMVLVNGRDLVEIMPNSTVTIGDDDASTADSNINLVNGTIHVEVGKRAPGKTFSIDAPYLVATVKGTQFDVSSSSERTSVAVTEGVVAVSADASGASVDVTVGNTAVVGRRNADKPKLSTTAGNIPGMIDIDETDETDETTETASADDGGNAGGSDSGGSGGSSSGGSDSGGNSGGSDSGGSDSGGSGSGGNSGGSDSGGSGGGSGGSDSGSGGSSSGSGGLGGAVGDATGALGGAVGGATDAVGDAVSGATGALGGAVGGPVGDTVSDVGDALGGAVSGVGGAVGGAVGGLGGALGGLLGGGK